jgi:outer membrane protein, adhesin transport system
MAFMSSRFKEGAEVATDKTIQGIFFPTGIVLLSTWVFGVALSQPLSGQEYDRRNALTVQQAIATAMVPTHLVFDQLLVGALQDHPSVRSARSQASGAKLDVEVAKWGRWPTVSLNNQQIAGQTGQVQRLSTLSVQQPLWSAGALNARVAATEKLDRASAEQVAVVQSELGLRLVEIWAAMLDAEASRQVSQQTLDVLMRYQGLMQRRVQAGLSSKVELRLLTVRVSRVQTDLHDAKVSLHIAAQRMAQIVGGPVDSSLPGLLMPMAQSYLADWVRWQSPSVSLQRLDQHPAIRKLELDAAAAADQLVVQKAERFPKLVLGYQQQLGDLPLTTRDRSAWTLGLNYTPGAGLANLSQSAADRERLQARLNAVDTLRQEKREQLLLDWSALLREFDRRASLESTISSASDVLISYERQYFSGLKTWLEVLNAVQELSQSQLRLAQAGNATTLAYYRWRLRGGELPLHADWTR